jgi:hypothetical protein
VIFNTYLVQQILNGYKTQTQRRIEGKHKPKIYKIGDRVGIQPGYKIPIAYVVITCRTKQSIGEITEEDAKWNPNADIDNNRAAGLTDLVILASHYGQNYP